MCGFSPVCATDSHSPWGTASPSSSDSWELKHRNWTLLRQKKRRKVDLLGKDEKRIGFPETREDEKRFGEWMKIESETRRLVKFDWVAVCRWAKSDLNRFDWGLHQSASLYWRQDQFDQTSLGIMSLGHGENFHFSWSTFSEVAFHYFNQPKPDWTQSDNCTRL